MPRTVSVVVPVKDGVRYLGELLAAVFAQSADAGALEVLVIDSGSRDGSQDAARAAGADVLEIASSEFGHGRTRNLGAERTSGELICFLTQDATPLPGWLAAYQAAFELGERVGAAYGPHRGRSDTSPMIARELREFFLTHGPDDRPTLQVDSRNAWLSNVNACYRRECWRAIRFQDVGYAEDQAFGAAMLSAGWHKVYQPAAAVMHAHDYPPVQFMRRYFDEYRGLRETIGHVEPIGLRSGVRDVRRLVAADRRWMRDQGWPASERLRWTGRSAAHHAGRKVFSALGSRAHRMPAPVQRTFSLEGTVGVSDPGPKRADRSGPPRGVAMASGAPHEWDVVRQFARSGPAPLAPVPPGAADEPALHFAVIIPPFRRGSGGHTSIFQLVSRLERRGHTVSLWIEDHAKEMTDQWPAVIRHNIREWFAPFAGPVFKDFGEWYGADVVVATGWQTVHRAMLLPGCRARAYLVHDHESEFYATSAEARWAEETYSLDLHAICSSPWLAEIVRERHGGTTSVFDFGVDHAVYHPRPLSRRRDTVMFYARNVTPRRAVPLGMLALREVHERRPDVRIVCFGSHDPVDAPFPYEHLGIASPEQLSWAYSEATVGVVLSMTNYSLVPQEMLACGLPCVDLAGFSAEGVFGADGPIELAPFHPVALADAIEHLLGDEENWRRRSQAGLAFVRGRTWDNAASQVEAGLREALRLRERSPV
jgi:glycosyltransferase involved in cell wall biosynthesis